MHEQTKTNAADGNLLTLVKVEALFCRMIFDIIAPYPDDPIFFYLFDVE